MVNDTTPEPMCTVCGESNYSVHSDPKTGQTRCDEHVEPSPETDWHTEAEKAGWMNPVAQEGEIPWEFFARHAGWREPAPVTDAELIERVKSIFRDSKYSRDPEWLRINVLGALEAARGMAP